MGRLKLNICSGPVQGNETPSKGALGGLHAFNKGTSTAGAASQCY